MLQRAILLWSHIQRNASKNDVIIIPGKLLGAGNIDKPVTIAAFNCSSNAQYKIKNAGGKFLTIPELIKQYPKGTGVKIYSK